MSGLPLFTELAGKSVLGNPGDDFVKRAGNQPSPFLFSSLLPCKSWDYSGALGRTRTCDLLIRSQNTCVCSRIWMLKNRISKPTSYSGCSQLFTWVTVKSLSKTVFRPGLCVFRKLFRGNRGPLLTSLIFSEASLLNRCHTLPPPK